MLDAVLIAFADDNLLTRTNEEAAIITVLQMREWRHREIKKLVAVTEPVRDGTGLRPSGCNHDSQHDMPL